MYLFRMMHRDIQGKKLLRCLNEFLSEMVKTALKDIYLGVKTPTSLQNWVATCRKMYYDKENQVMINQTVKKIYTRFLLKIGALLQELLFPLDIAATFFNNLSPDGRYLLISEGVQVPQRLPTENNHQLNQRLLLVRNAEVESEKNIRAIKASVKPSSGSLCHKTFMILPGGSP